MREKIDRYVNDLTITGKTTVIVAIAGFGILLGTLIGGT